MLKASQQAGEAYPVVKKIIAKKAGTDDKAGNLLAEVNKGGGVPPAFT